MTAFARRCGAFDAAACERAWAQADEWGLERVRIAWADWHGATRVKTVTLRALESALVDGVSMVSTLLLKDSSDRTALPVFEPGAMDGLPGFGAANNVVLLPVPGTLQRLPWAPATGWMRAEPWFDDATPVLPEPRRALVAALDALAREGWALRCGLEVEFHVYRIEGAGLDPARAEWPGEPPAVTLLHPGWQLLGEACTDLADEPLAIVQRSCEALGLPLRSLEVELGPSQLEAVFDVTDALAAADAMVLFRSAVRQALRRAGWHASFVCRPPFANAMASGWHLHQSLVSLADGRSAFVPASAGEALSAVGRRWLAGLLAHARGATLFATPTVNGYGRFRPNAMAPTSVCWGRDHRGALLRVLGGAGDEATRIENRLGEPLANPYLYLASQVHAGLDGLRRGLEPPPPAGVSAAAAAGAPALPASLDEAVAAFEAGAAMVQGFGAPLARVYAAIKRQEAARHAAAEDGAAWQRREYFGRF